jgi:hypothetical protein
MALHTCQPRTWAWKDVALPMPIRAITAQRSPKKSSWFKGIDFKRIIRLIKAANYKSSELYFASTLEILGSYFASKPERDTNPSNGRLRCAEACEGTG